MVISFQCKSFFFDGVNDLALRKAVAPLIFQMIIALKLKHIKELDGCCCYI